MLRRDVPVPLYHQLEMILRQAIEDGYYAPGELFPTEKDLQQTYNVSRATVRTAISRLSESGLLRSERGRGTFVTEAAVGLQKIERDLTHLFAFDEDLRRSGCEVTIEVLSIEAEIPPRRVSDLLEIARGQEVFRLRRRGFVGGDPLWLESRYFHPALNELVVHGDWSGGAVTSNLSDLLHAPITGTKVRITAAAATDTQAERLEIHPGDPVLTNEFMFIDANERPVDVTHATFRADRYAFTFLARDNGVDASVIRESSIEYSAAEPNC